MEGAAEKFETITGLYTGITYPYMPKKEPKIS
jgi:hypothetical protein